MSVDVAAAIADSLRDPRVRLALADALAPIVDERLRAVLEQQREALLPLSEILRCQKRAASARIRRDAGLRALGVPLGRGRFGFKRAEVEAYLRRDGESR